MCFRYISYSVNESSEPSDIKKVISMSLYGSDPKYTYGALRNAQLTPIIFPGWALRVYAERPDDNGKYKYDPVPLKILTKLTTLGAEVVSVNADILNIPPMMWRFLVADDMTVDYFIVRDADSRLTERDKHLVEEWIKSKSSFHCVRDHPSHVSDPVYGGLWGAKPKELRQLLVTPINLLMKGYGMSYAQDIFFMSNAVWPRVRSSAFCHDSIACNKFPLSQPIIQERHEQEHVGQVYDAFGDARQIDIDILKYTSLDDFCIKSSQHGGRRPPLTDHGDVVPVGADKYLSPKVEKIVAPSSLSRIVIWTMDYHISPIMDLKDLLEPFGVTFVDKSLSPMCAITNTCAKNLHIVNSDTALKPTEDLIQKFVDTYSVSEDMKNVTHVLCSGPPAICEFYLKLKKVVIIYVTNRYEEARVSLKDWNQWNRHLYEISWEKSNIIASNNHYDAEYIRYFTGIHPEYVPSYCGYTNTSYVVKKTDYLLMPIKDAKFKAYFTEELQKTIKTTRVHARVKYMRDVYPSYNYSDISSHAGVIYVPHQVSMISMCEHYRMNIPLFFPTLNLLTRWHQEHGVITNRTFNKERQNLGEKGDKSPLDGVAGHFDPNDETSERNLIYWLRYADFYQWPYIVHYDSIDHLVYLLESSNLPALSYKMNRFNKKLKNDILKKWIDLLKKSMS